MSEQSEPGKRGRREGTGGQMVKLWAACGALRTEAPTPKEVDLRTKGGGGEEPDGAYGRPLRLSENKQ